MKRNQMLSLLLAAVLFCFLSAPSAILADGDFVLNDDKTALIKYNGKASFVSVDDGVQVIRGGAFAGNKAVNTVYLADSVTEIEGGAFENCQNLQNIVISGNSKLSVIGAYAFAGCPLLNSSFATDVRSVSPDAFSRKTEAKNNTQNNSASAKTGQTGGKATPNPASATEQPPASTLPPDNGGAAAGTLKILQQPISVQAREGDFVTFTVVAEGSESIQYQWRRSKDGEHWATILSNSSAFQNANTNALSFTVTNAISGYRFKCLVIDNGEMISSNVVSILSGDDPYLPADQSGNLPELETLINSAPSAIGAWQQTESSVLVIWGPTEFAVGYELYRSTNDGEPELIQTLTDCSYTDNGLDLSRNSYSYSVAAVLSRSASGNPLRSEMSESAPVELLSTAQNGVEVDGVAYTFTPEGAVVTAYRGKASSLKIPSKVQKGNLTYTVIAIGPDVFRNNRTLKFISLPSTIEVIESGAFAYCNAMIDH